jgi:hypothetical protein
MEAISDQEVKVKFDCFWVDIGTDSPRPGPPASSTSESVKDWGRADTIMSAVGRAVFFPQFAIFPVRYLDQDIAGVLLRGGDMTQSMPPGQQLNNSWKPVWLTGSCKQLISRN